MRVYTHVYIVLVKLHQFNNDRVY